MRYIKKQEEPMEFIAWKGEASEVWQPTWDILAGPPKEALKTSLIEEQGYICCYCGQEVKIDSSHIEHVIPKDKRPDLELDYYNLAVSCQSNRKKTDPLHCGNKKDNWYEKDLFLTPFTERCEERFRYTANGNIYPKTDADQTVKTTIEKLGLDDGWLNSARKKVLEAIIADLDELTSEDLQLMKNSYSSFDGGKLKPFCFVIESFIEGYI